MRHFIDIISKPLTESFFRSPKVGDKVRSNDIDSDFIASHRPQYDGDTITGIVRSDRFRGAWTVTTRNNSGEATVKWNDGWVIVDIE